MTTNDRIGALPSQAIRQMINNGAINGSLGGDAIQPASLDLSLGREIYRVSSVFFPRPDETVLEAMSRFSPEIHDISIPLEVGVTYIARLSETLALPDGVYGYANPKSSSGRCDVHTRLLADGVSGFDSMCVKGYTGSLWTLITPRSFRPLLHERDSLSQARFFNRDTRITNHFDLEKVYREHTLLYRPNGDPIPFDEIHVNERDGALLLTVNLDLDVVGYRCERNQMRLDWSKIGYYNPLDFFQPILRPKNGSLILRAGDFYILTTKEYIQVPSNLAAEMIAINPRSGDHRAHYAGYFDPGWGLGPDGALKGAPGVMEVRSPMDDISLQDGQSICKMSFERMAGVPDILYGTKSNYLYQRGPKLSKHFKTS
jgi:dCTP deaminase